MINQYWGATQYVGGASALYSRAILRVQEGYMIGSTTEYIDIGDFQIEDFTNEGAFRQTLSLSATNKSNGLNKTNTMVPYKFHNYNYWHDNFLNEHTLENNYFTENENSDSWEVVSSTLGISATSGEVNSVWVKDSETSDLRMITKVKTSTNTYDVSTIFRATSFSPKEETGYYLQLMNPQTIRLIETTAGATTVVSTTTGISLVNNTYLWLMVTARGSNIKCYASVDGNSYTKYIDATDYKHKKGFCGVKVEGKDNRYTVDDIDFVEIGNQYTAGDVIRKASAWGGVDNISIQKDVMVQDFDGFRGNSGSSWIAGITNGYPQVDCHGSSQEWNMYLNSNNSMWSVEGNLLNVGDLRDSSFCFQCDIKGSSGAEGGLFMGCTGQLQSFWGFLNWYKFGGTNNTIDTFKTTRTHVFENRGEYLRLRPDIWYSAKMMKRGYYYSWYINDVLANSIYGPSNYYFADAQSTYVGFGGKGLSGTIFSARNPQINILSGFIEDTNVSIGTKPSSVLERYLPAGCAIGMRGNTFNIFEMGETMYTGMSKMTINHYIQADENRSNRNIVEAAVTGELDSAITTNSDVDVQHKIDSSMVSTFSDKNLADKDQSNKEVYSLIHDKMRKDKIFSITTHIYPHIERGDFIDYTNTELGIANEYLIRKITKQYDMEVGDYRETLMLGTRPTWNLCEKLWDELS